MNTNQSALLEHLKVEGSTVCACAVVMANEEHKTNAKHKRKTKLKGSHPACAPVDARPRFERWWRLRWSVAIVPTTPASCATAAKRKSVAFDSFVCFVRVNRTNLKLLLGPPFETSRRQMHDRAFSLFARKRLRHSRHAHVELKRFRHGALYAL